MVEKKGDDDMTREEAEKLVADLTEEQKVILFLMLSSLQQNPSPAEVEQGKGSREC